MCIEPNLCARDQDSSPAPVREVQPASFLQLAGGSYCHRFRHSPVLKGFSSHASPAALKAVNVKQGSIFVKLARLLSAHMQPVRQSDASGTARTSDERAHGTMRQIMPRITSIQTDALLFDMDGVLIDSTPEV